VDPPDVVDEVTIGGRLADARGSQAVRKTAMQWPWLYRFVILALHTGSRRGVLFRLQWDQIDFSSGVIHRNRPGEKEEQTQDFGTG
jgi:integrase